MILFALAAAAAAAVPADVAADASDNRPTDVVVTGERLDEAPQAGKTDVPLIETPQAISIISTESLRVRGVTRLAEALRQSAGVTRSSTYGFYDAYTIRGFDAAYGSVYLDGLLSPNVAGTNNEVYGLEQVEVVKGPASMLFGAGPLGGLINLVSKRPQPEAFADVSLASGSYDLIEASADVNAPLSGALSARLNLVYRDSGTFVRYSGQNRVYVAPAVTWRPGPATSLTILGRFQRDDDQPWSPVSAWGTVLPWIGGKLPIDTAIANDDPRTSEVQDAKQIGYIFDHRFSDAFSISQTLRYADLQTRWRNWMFWSGFIDNEIGSAVRDADGGLLSGIQLGHIAGRYLYGPFRESDRTFQVDSRATLKFATGPVRHTILAGVDYRDLRQVYSDDGGNFDPTVHPLDLFDPDYDAPLIVDPSGAYGERTHAQQTGVYVQDHLAFGDVATLTLGGRYDWASGGGQDDEKFSPRVGATVNVARGAALYASWSKSFVPQTGYLTFDGEPLPPETGRNLEGGLKLQTADGRITGMISVFDLVRQNVVTADPEHPLFSVVTGEQASRGVEVEGSWRVTPAMTLGLAYAHIDAKVTRDTVFVVGAQLPNAPRDAINLFGNYEVQGGALAGLGMNLAFQYNASKNGTIFIEDLDFDGIGDPMSFFRLPAYALLDVGLSYRTGPWTARVNVNNVTNERYFPDACCTDRVTPGEPRNFRITLMRHF